MFWGYFLILCDVFFFSFSFLVPRIPPAGKSEKGDVVDPIKPVFIGEFPQVVRDEQTSILRKHIPGQFNWLQ